ncbi:hypothetical protein SAMN02745704_01593 [Paucidesulfovibrio gracilis DSM 16080]|uniref:VPLPA-CTERM protein sorting domain-containing protein n=1 Tax=Paucidesulfovibrio gracilis DSM 16080 TaxID=1121449 RepID=A0A1T4X1Y4_9BACT|nr:hypothetical protein [Paucidesulfovibrio gracilis]SKA83085.1 hypothetical protein SAMN02745704_01593 [Paucidesulfovibrio gracilis DSM 16080]
MKNIWGVILFLVMIVGAGPAMAANVTASYGIGSVDAPALEQFLFNKYIDNVTETFDVDHGQVAAGASPWLDLNVGDMVGVGYVDTGTAAHVNGFAATGDRFYSNWNELAGGPGGYQIFFDPAREHKAVGFYLTGFDSSESYTLTLGLTNGTYTVDLGSMVSESVALGDSIYFGFETDTSFVGSFWVNSTDLVGMDNISTMTTPIPGAVWLFGTGLFGLLGYRRLRS